MSDRLVSVLLIGFAILFLFVVLAWIPLRRMFGIHHPEYTKTLHKYNRLSGIHISFRIILVAFAIVSFVYFVYPQTQSWFVPIHWLNNDYVNATGFVILFIAFILVVLNQLKLDKSLHDYYFDPLKQSDSSLVPKTESNLLKSILLVFVGLFVVVSTIATGMLLIVALIVYYLRSSNRKYRVRTPLASKQQPYL